MTLPIEIGARRDVLAAYRIARYHHEAPRTAAQLVKYRHAVALSDFVSLHGDATGSGHVARYEASCVLVAQVAACALYLPFWQTGKVTFAPPSMSWLPPHLALNTDEAVSGECWTCQAVFSLPEPLVDHVREAHGRDAMNEHDMPGVPR